MLRPTKWYPKPHNMIHRWKHSLNETTANKDTVIYPISIYDEGMGAPGSYNAHPEHASFAESNSPNCYPDSEIHNIFTQMTISGQTLLFGEGVSGNQIQAINYAYMPIYMTHEDGLAIDELTSLEVQDILETERDATDRQTTPLWNGVKVDEIVANDSLLATDVFGLTTNQKLEHVTFSEQNYYDCLQYMTNSGKLKVCNGGLKWMTLKKGNPVHKINFHIRPKTKRMVPYSFFGVMIHIPEADSLRQLVSKNDASADVEHLQIKFTTRFQEWNQGYNFDRV